MLNFNRDEFIDYFVSAGVNILICNGDWNPTRVGCEKNFRQARPRGVIDYERQVERANGKIYRYEIITGESSGIDAVIFENTGEVEIRSFIEDVIRRVPALDAAPIAELTNGGYIFYVQLNDIPDNMYGRGSIRLKSTPNYSGMSLYSDYYPVVGPGQEYRSGTVDLISGDFDSIPHVSFFDLKAIWHFEFIEDDIPSYSYRSLEHDLANKISRLIDELAITEGENGLTDAIKFALKLTNHFDLSIDDSHRFLKKRNEKYAQPLNGRKLYDLARWARCHSRSSHNSRGSERNRFNPDLVEYRAFNQTEYVQDRLAQEAFLAAYERQERMARIESEQRRESRRRYESKRAARQSGFKRSIF